MCLADYFLLGSASNEVIVNLKQEAADGLSQCKIECN
jgi:hypothetical protein